MSPLAPGFYRQPLVKASVSKSRDELLLSLSAGKRVLHVGCADAPMTTERLATGTLLHELLMKTASAVHGVDIDTEAVELMRSAIGGEYTIADVTEPEGRSGLSEFDADLVLAGDVIEHVPNPGAFVAGLAALRRADGGPIPLVLSTPNALAIKITVNTLFGRELIHPDHVNVYTPASLRELLRRCGLTVERSFYYHTSSGDRVLARAYDAIAHLCTAIRPAFAEGQIVVCHAPPASV